MPDLSQLFDWSYWTPEKSEIFRNLSLAVSGVVGLAFLIWRAIATDRLSRASLRQANTAISQLQLNMAQVSNADRTAKTQLDIMSKNLEVSTKTLDSNTENHLFERFVSTIASLSNAKNTMERSICIILVGELAKKHVDFLITSSDALWRLAKVTAHGVGFRLSPSADFSRYELITSADVAKIATDG